MDIFESLENLQVSEACFEDIIMLVEDILDEGYSVKGAKNAAGNSIQPRKDAIENLEAEYKRYNGKLPATQQKELDNWYETNKAKLEDRLHRAEYFKNNLPNSEVDIKRVIKAADKVVDKRADDSDEQHQKKKEALENKGNASYDELVKKVGNSNAAHYRARHAAILAGKPAPDDSDEGRREVGNYKSDEVSPKKRNEQLKKDIETAEKNYDEARSTHIRDKIRGVWDSKHANALDSTVSKLNQAKHNWNQNTRTLK